MQKACCATRRDSAHHAVSLHQLPPISTQQDAPIRDQTLPQADQHPVCPVQKGSQGRPSHSGVSFPMCSSPSPRLRGAIGNSPQMPPKFKCQRSSPSRPAFRSPGGTPTPDLTSGRDYFQEKKCEKQQVYLQSRKDRKSRKSFPSIKGNIGPPRPCISQPEIKTRVEKISPFGPSAQPKAISASIRWRRRCLPDCSTRLPSSD